VKSIRLAPTAPVDDVGFAEPVDFVGEDIVVAVAGAAGRRLGAASIERSA